MNGEDAVGAAPPADAGTTAPVVPPTPLPRKTGSWAIDYRNGLMEEISHAAAEDLTVETGGILIGSLQRRTIFIDSWAAVSCEHAHGPAMVLSPADRVKLLETLAAHRGTGGIASGPIGWMVSHRGGELRPSEADLELFQEHFPEPWHILLVVKPEPRDTARLAFFVREPDGSMNAFRAYRESVIRPKATQTLPERSGSLVRTRPSERIVNAEPAMAVIPGPKPAAEEERPKKVRSPLRWAWLALPAVAIAVAVAVFGFWLRPAEADPPLEVTLNDSNGQLVIRWTVPPQLLETADFGALTVKDGDAQQTMRLKKSDLRHGTATWERHSGDVRVDLMVWRGGVKNTGVAEFFGAPPVPKAAGNEAVPPALEKENADLREQVAAANARAKAAENLVRILKGRLNVEGGGSVARR